MALLIVSAVSIVSSVLFVALLAAACGVIFGLSRRSRVSATNVTDSAEVLVFASARTGSSAVRPEQARTGTGV